MRSIASGSNNIPSGHDSWVHSVAFGSNNVLASGSDDMTVKVWDSTTGASIRTLTGHGSYMRSVAFGSKNLLASDTTIKLWVEF